MASPYDNYKKNKPPLERQPSKYKQKVQELKQHIKDYVHENAALLDEIKEVQVETIIRNEERKYLLRKLCEFEPQTALEVQNAAKSGPNATTHHPVQSVEASTTKKNKKRSSQEIMSERKSPKSRKSSAKIRKKIVQPIPLDGLGRPIFPIELGNLRIHSLGDVVTDRQEFHAENAIYPVGFVSTRVYGSLKDPTVKCIYTCKISDINGSPRFEIASDDSSPSITGDTADICHSVLLQKINDALAFNAVSIRPRGNDFFGLTHPTVLNLIQSSPGTRKCTNYKWCKFEVSRHGDHYVESNDAALSFQVLQKSIEICKYKMAPDVLQKPSDEYANSKGNFHGYF